MNPSYVLYQHEGVRDVSVMLLNKRLLSVLILSMVAFSTVVAVGHAAAEERRGLQVGDLLTIESIRGTAGIPGSEDSAKATLTLTATVTEVDEKRVKFEIVSGEISFGDKTCTVNSGGGGAILGKFGWIMLSGEATPQSGELHKFRLEGMLHIEGPRLVVAGMTGGIGDEDSRTPLRVFVRISRAQ